MSIEVDVWVRGTMNAVTHEIDSLPADPSTWDAGDVRRLLSEMLLALEREKNPGGDRPEVHLRGFSWIVSPIESGGVLVHLEMQMGTASAGPLAVDQEQLTALITRAIAKPDQAQVVH
jgi:hypothetical protein